MIFVVAGAARGVAGDAYNMIYDCPLHGKQGCALISPDLIDSAIVSENDLLMVEIQIARTPCFLATLSRTFAEENNITRQVVDCSETLSWFGALRAMCGRCYADRWPRLV